MRYAAVALVVLLLSASALARESLLEMKARADRAKPAECAKLCVKVAWALANQSNQFFNQGKHAEGHKAMQEAFDYALRAARGAIQSKKHEKHTEINIRKLIDRIQDIRETLGVDDRPPLDAGLKQLEQARTDLLYAMFGVPKTSMREVLKQEEKKK